MKTINYESDFKLIEGFKDGSSITAAPFRFTYYTKASRDIYVAEYNGAEYSNCYPDGDKLVIPFDNPKLGIGQLNVKREFFLNDADFKDGICNIISVEKVGVELWQGATDGDCEVEVDVLPFFPQVEQVVNEKRTINFESDFKIIERLKGDVTILDAPFKFTYYTNQKRGEYVVSYDGNNFFHCYPMADGSLVIPFDNHRLGVGVLQVKREFFLSDKEFTDGQCHLVTVMSTGITLDIGRTDSAAEVVLEHAANYQKGDAGKSAYQEWLDLGNEGTIEDYINSMRGEPFTYDDFTEEQLAALTGPKGDKGDKGDRGERGEKGEQGIQGVQGEQGVKGDKGDRGEQGEQGIQGERGERGERGLDGQKGDKGDKGDAFTYQDFTPEQLLSLKGEKGDKGDRGEQGIQGAQGERGERGYDGAQGIQGERGEKGDRGEQGIQGIQGEKGEQGDKGEKGDKGDPMTFDELTTEEIDDIASRVPRIFKETTLNFGANEDTLSVALMDDGMELTEMRTSNVKTLYVSYGSVIKQQVGDSPINMGDAEFLVVNIVRNTESTDAVVGLQFKI